MSLPLSSAPETARPAPRRGMPPVAGVIANRLIAALFAVFAAVTIVFVMITLAGDPAVALAPEDASAETIERIRERFGFDQPIIVQYGRFMADLVTGEFPSSLYSQKTAFQVVAERLGNSLLLAGVGVSLAVLIGGVTGYFSVFGRGRLVRSLPLSLLMLFQSIPAFMTGILLILLFALNLRWLPTSGARDWYSLIMPSLTVSLALAPAIARLLRSALREQVSADYVSTARAKGISPRRIRLHHILGNSLVPVVTLIGLQAGGLLSGIVVVETVFAWPGLGYLLVTAVNLHDYPVVVTAVVVVALGYVTLSLIVDLLVMALNPRARE